MTKLQILKAARHLLSDPKHWTQGAFARAEDGAEVCSTGYDGVSFCLAGAFRRFGGGSAQYYMGLAPNGRTWPDWNDDSERIHADVLAELDLAIARESALTAGESG